MSMAGAVAMPVIPLYTAMSCFGGRPYNQQTVVVPGARRFSVLQHSGGRSAHATFCWYAAALYWRGRRVARCGMAACLYSRHRVVVLQGTVGGTWLAVRAPALVG